MQREEAKAKLARMVSDMNYGPPTFSARRSKVAADRFAAEFVEALEALIGGGTFQETDRPYELAPYLARRPDADFGNTVAAEVKRIIEALEAQVDELQSQIEEGVTGARALMAAEVKQCKRAEQAEARVTELEATKPVVDVRLGGAAFIAEPPIAVALNTNLDFGVDDE